MEKECYTANIKETADRLASDIIRGLSEEEAAVRLDKYGSNELMEKEGPTLLSMFLRQFNSFLIFILIAASVVSFFVGEKIDALVILVIIIMNSVFGVYQEFKAGKAIESLRKMARQEAKVVRGGERLVIPVANLVPGDLVLLDSGDYVPADMRLIETVNLKIDESTITGESVPVEKYAHLVFDNEKSLGDRTNVGYKGTTVTYGRGRGLVTATGMNTEIGNIAEMIQTVTEKETPLQKKLGMLGRYLGIGCLIICTAVFFLGLLRGYELVDIFMISISLAVAAIPEGLPAVITIVLALGMQRMVKKQVVIKKLHAVETLGSTTVICSDKTGTLTQNQMTAVKIVTSHGCFDITGKGYSPLGEYLKEGKAVPVQENDNLTQLLYIAALCNDSVLKNCDNTWSIIGDPTEGALTVLAAKAGYDKNNLEQSFPRIGEIPFDSERKLMTTFHRFPEGLYAFCKGAPDVLLKRCTHMQAINKDIEVISDSDKDNLYKTNEDLAKQALRILALAYKPIDSLPDKPVPEEIENGLIFSGLIGMIDPARDEAIEAIKTCKEAGIRVIMITGDYKETAAAIANKLGILEDGTTVLSGVDLNSIEKDAMVDAVQHTNVFARVSPQHKVALVTALKERNEIVAMTGDGVNDAPALKRADIGVAMGITGTDVTKETADMVLTNDNFTSIVTAIEEGRVVYSNIRKFVFFLLSCNISEILIVFVAMLLDWPVPLVAIQLLLVNLITDAFPALALGAEQKEPNIMKQPPRNPNEPIINKSLRKTIITHTLFLTISVLSSFYLSWTLYADPQLARTYAFSTLIIAELLRAYTARSEYYTLRQIGYFSNRYMNYAAFSSLFVLLIILFTPSLQLLFKISSLTMFDWYIIIPFSFLPFIFGELLKVMKQKSLV